jgi:hypothetical protein
LAITRQLPPPLPAAIVTSCPARAAILAKAPDGRAGVGARALAHHQLTRGAAHLNAERTAAGAIGAETPGARREMGVAMNGWPVRRSRLPADELGSKPAKATAGISISPGDWCARLLMPGRNQQLQATIKLDFASRVRDHRRRDGPAPVMMRAGEDTGDEGAAGMAVDMRGLLADLTAETRVLKAMLVPLDEAGWDRSATRYPIWPTSTRPPRQPPPIPRGFVPKPPASWRRGAGFPDEIARRCHGCRHQSARQWGR